MSNANNAGLIQVSVIKPVKGANFGREVVEIKSKSSGAKMVFEVYTKDSGSRIVNTCYYQEALEIFTMQEFNCIVEIMSPGAPFGTTY